MGLVVQTAPHPEQDEQYMPYDWFVGIDWGSQQHQVCVLDRDRRRWVIDPSTMTGPVSPGWRLGCGACRQANRSGSPWRLK